VFDAIKFLNIDVHCIMYYYEMPTGTLLSCTICLFGAFCSRYDQSIDHSNGTKLHLINVFFLLLKSRIRLSVI
jgi:hypothetical protein